MFGDVQTSRHTFAQLRSIGIGDLETCRTRMSLWKDFKTDETELAMYFYCPGVLFSG